MGKYKNLDRETALDIMRCTADHVMANLRSMEDKILAERHEKRVEAMKDAVRRYRKIMAYSDALAKKALSAEDDVTLRDLLDMVENRGAETRRLNILLDNASAIRTFANHLKASIESYRSICENVGSDTDRRRYRILEKMYLSDEYVGEKATAERIAKSENVDRSSVYEDVNNACEELAILFFSVKSLDL